jgi:hypothetical protein
MPIPPRTFFFALGILLGSGFAFAAKDIPQDKYILYLPLHQPKIVTQTQASQEFFLYGNPENPSYQDTDPIDGIDDNRCRILKALSQRFAPFLVQNTKAIPLDFNVYLDDEEFFPLVVDTWETAREHPVLIQSEKIRLDRETEKLLSLFRRYHPLHPQSPSLSAASTGSETEQLQVLYFDFPGQDEKSWREEYEKLLSQRDEGGLPDPVLTYVHPFICEIKNPHDSLSGYEIILQYWFFYPFNDGGNNHEGDWEHINVAVSPVSRMESPMNGDDIRSVLRGSGLSDADRNHQLAIKRVEYYFHHQVVVLDYSRPNVYLPEEEWRERVDSLGKNRVGQAWIWKRIRYLAFADETEQTINTHPVGYIGGDNRGYDQILALPGPKNRDPHGTYPFPGIFKSIGPAEASEKMSSEFDHKKIKPIPVSSQRAGPEPFGRGHVARFDYPSRIKIIPDWERLTNLIEVHPSARREWIWLVLPIRWGFPASASPLAGVIAHADTGNQSSLGPAYNAGWNRTHAGPGYDLYEPHRLPSWLPLDWQRHFKNQWGTLNGFFPTLLNMPPLDICVQLLSSVFCAFDQSRVSVFTPAENLPFRHIGFSAGVFSQTLPEDFFLSSLSQDHIKEIEERIIREYPTFPHADMSEKIISETATGGLFRVSLHLGQHLSSENTLSYFQSQVGEDIVLFGRSMPFRLRAGIQLWQYSGSFRVNLATRSILPFVKAGYGWSWHRLENIRLDGTSLNLSSTAWHQKPSLFKFQNLKPNTWQWGAGIEILPFKNRTGFDLGIQMECTRFSQSLLLTLEGLLGSGEPEKRRIRSRRGEFCLSLSFSY